MDVVKLEREIRYKNDAKCHSLLVCKSSKNWTKILTKYNKLIILCIYFGKIIENLKTEIHYTFN